MAVGEIQRPVRSARAADIMTWNLREWLGMHAVRVERIGNEEVFTHFTGESSVVVLREGWIDDLIATESDDLGELFSDLLGASIGDGHIVIGTPVVDGLAVSHGFTIPDLNYMKAQAEDLGMLVHPFQRVFIMQACWMFFYSLENRGGRNVLLRYDRDFRREDEVPDLQSVLDDWWKMVMAEPNPRAGAAE
jgi:hypothetical protein